MNITCEGEVLLVVGIVDCFIAFSHACSLERLLVNDKVLFHLPIQLTRKSLLTKACLMIHGKLELFESAIPYYSTELAFTRRPYMP
jgi:hypothetical protein